MYVAVTPVINWRVVYNERDVENTKLLSTLTAGLMNGSSFSNAPFFSRRHARVYISEL